MKTTSQAPSGQVEPPQLERARQAVCELGTVILLEAIEERWSAPNCRGVASEIICAARQWLNGGPLDHPIIKAAYELVRLREQAEKVARLQEVA